MKYYKNCWQEAHPHEIYRVYPDGTFDYIYVDDEEKIWWRHSVLFDLVKEGYKAVEITEQEAFIEIL